MNAFLIRAFLLAVVAGASLSLQGAQRLATHIQDTEKNDLPEILENRYFRVLTSRNAFDYHVYQGKAGGYQYELMKAFTEHLNKLYQGKGLKIQFELIPADYDQLFPMLQEGKGDIIAANLAITPEREKLASFSASLMQGQEVLVTRKELAKLAPYGKSIALRKSSSYFESVARWNQGHPEKSFLVERLDEQLTPENILELVSKGKYDYTLIDAHLLEAAEAVYANLVPAEVQPFESEKAQLAFAVRKGSPKLLEELNKFVPTVRAGTLLGNIINQKYFNHAILLKAREGKQGAISPYDHLLKKYAKQYGWDWKLLAALAFQESRFRQDIENRWGAIGIFQVKQMTADEPYVSVGPIKGEKNAENNIHAGVKYLSWIRDRYFKDLPPRRRIRMTLAAYNAGPATVRRARARAKEMGLDPNIWFRNVELAMSSMRKREPVNYVSEINKRYVAYALLFAEEQD